MSEIVDLILPESNIYNNKFWRNVEELNKDNFKHFNIDIDGIEPLEILWFVYEYDSSSRFRFNELDLINKQYRLLQEMYYSRLEAKNE
jgi:hypothetical protein